MKNIKNIVINSIKDIDQEFESVERKGIGHPDTLCDAIAERASRDYSKYCLNQFGRVGSHWFDKVILLGGESRIDYGRGDLLSPYVVIFAGKAVLKIGENKIPIKKILYTAAADVLSSTLVNFQPEKHLKIDIKIHNYRGPGQNKNRYKPKNINDLVDIFSNERVSNDCNICVGYAPFSLLESMVLELEKELSTGNIKKQFPDTGNDIKIVATRYRNSIVLQVNIPFIAKHIFDNKFYIQRVKQMEETIIDFIKSKFNRLPEVIVNPEKYSGRAYLTVTGSVADTGDVGVVGRGNRINGLITPFRPMSIEASAGKNPLDHTGKLYNIIAKELAMEVYKETGLKNIIIFITSKEKPINIPDFSYISLVTDEKNLHNIKEQIQKKVEEKLAGIFYLSKKIIYEGVIQW